ncbi:MAG: nitroreductase family protein [Clostridia bacterium]|nr:nitroreductase family protein [Clostridia bacterium]
MLKEIVSRRSIRKYKDTPVTDEQLQKILEAGRLAPTGSNTQPLRFIVLKSEESRRQVMEVDGGQERMLQAPLIIGCVGDLSCRIDDCSKVNVNEHDNLEETKQVLRDCAIGIESMMLQAEHMGLGTCYTGWYEQEPMKAALGVPDYCYVAGVLVVGYADEAPAARPRRALEDITYIDCWGNK